MKYFLFILFLFVSSMSYAQSFSIKGKVSIENGRLPSNSEAYLVEKSSFRTIDKDGNFSFDSLITGTYHLNVFANGYNTLKETVEINNHNQNLIIKLQPLSAQIKTISIEEKKENHFGISRLKPIEGTAIYAGKKSSVVEMEDIAANLATNNSRQIFSKVAGLNVWENDDAGIQLAIGGRGLNPNRLSNFNSRQNGYDISADALGYPESYYTPPAEAISQIQIVRGAASLQYGTQFGGFINFKLKDGPKIKKFELISRQTVGSNGLFSSFNSLGGNKGKWKYYGYYQYKTGDGWRPNSGFDVHNAHANVSYHFNSKLSLRFEYTYMHYLEQQAGGLTDLMYKKDPHQSIRSRNWFQVNWNLAALNLDYAINDKTDFNMRAFHLFANRDAVGNLGYITRTDHLGTPRNLESGKYNNYGIENRLLHRYSLFNNTSIFLIGMRYYNGKTENGQGDGSSGNNADFSFVNPKEPNQSDYDFPSQNLAFFSENVFYLTPKLSVTPGLRYEYISTNSDGYYFSRSTNLAGEIINEQKIYDQQSNARSFLLGGIGLSYKKNEHFEVYGNFSQNYRSINFNDMRIVNPNYQVDTNLRDEKGYSADIGIRGNKNNWFNYDVSLFLLSYQNRIGDVSIIDQKLFRPIRFRTNIADSRSVGIESFAEANLLALVGKGKSKSKLNLFVNLSWMNARYFNSKETAYENKKVELVPEIIFKSGLSYRYQKLMLSLLYSYTDEQYTDATNADFSPNAVTGIVPAYHTFDLSLKYHYKKWVLESGINNLSNETYFTRRAAGYPGPGIIPAKPRTYYLTLGIKL